MKILFINPCLRLGSKLKYLPVGVASIMTYVRKHGYKFDFLDIDINDYDDDYVEDYLKKNDYDVVLAGSIVTHYKWMKWLAKTVKGYCSSTKVVVGNSVAGSVPEVFLRNSGADVVVIGEGEESTLKVLNSFKNKTSLHDVEGIAFLDNEEYIKTNKRKVGKIDDLPMVEWDFFDTEKYFEKSKGSSEGVLNDEGQRTIPVVTARGCVFKCTFCHYVFWDDPYRHRSVESILTEIKRNIDLYNVNYINFWDDLSFSSLKQAERLVDAIIDSGLKFHWNAAVRVDLFGHPRFSYEKRLEVARKFKQAGCLNLGFSLESGNQEILNMMNKKINKEYFIDQVKVLREAGIACSVSVVFGYPIETKETIAETFQMCLDGKVYPSIGYLLPLPYTGMYKYARENGFITDENAYLDSITERQDLCLNMTKMSDGEVMRYIKDGATQLNKMLELNLEADKLIKTGGYKKHTKIKKTETPVDTENMKRNKNDFSFNYSKEVFSNKGQDRGMKTTSAENK